MNKTKLSKVKELLAKMLEVEVEFASATTDKGIIFYEGELAEGINVYVEDAEGNKVAAEDGTYTIEEEMTKKIIEVKNGVVVSIEELEITVEEPVEEPVEDGNGDFAAEGTEEPVGAGIASEEDTEATSERPASLKSAAMASLSPSPASTASMPPGVRCAGACCAMRR